MFIKKILFLAFFLFSSCYVPNLQKSAVSVALYSSAVLLTEEDVPFCGAVYIYPGYLLTSYHCVSGLDVKKIKVLFYNVKDTFKVVGGYASQKLDLALLQINTAPFLKTANLAFKSPSVGENVYIVGAPGGETFFVGSGMISKVNIPYVVLNSDTIKGNICAVDGRAFFGNSGGGVFDAYGNLIGITIGTQFFVERFETKDFFYPLWLYCQGVEKIKIFLSVALKEALKNERMEYEKKENQ